MDFPGLKGAKHTIDCKKIPVKNSKKVTITVKIGNKWVDEKMMSNFENPTFLINESKIPPPYINEGEIPQGMIVPIKSN